MPQLALRQIYDRIGGHPALRVILNDFYARLERDVMIGFFFSGQDVSKIAEKQLNFLLKAMGV